MCPFWKMGDITSLEMGWVMAMELGMVIQRVWTEGILRESERQCRI